MIQFGIISFFKRGNDGNQTTEIIIENVKIFILLDTPMNR